MSNDMFVKFSVPDFPVFQKGLNSDDYRRYAEYLRKFESYAAYAVTAQVSIAEKAVEKGHMKDEIAVLNETVKSINEAATHCVERASMIVESDVQHIKDQISSEVDKLSEALLSVSAPVLPEPIVIVKVADDDSVPRGPNWERNVKTREARKLRKAHRKLDGVDWRKRDAVGSRGIRSTTSTFVGARSALHGDLKEKPVPISSGEESVSFWRSCETKLRKDLVTSKAEMHIAENRRRTMEAINRVNHLSSPQAAVERAVKLAELAEEIGKKSEDSVVHGFAKTVTSSSAESLVRSLPDSVTSYHDFERRKMESELNQKLTEVCGRIAQLESELSQAKTFHARDLAECQSAIDAEKKKFKDFEAAEKKKFKDFEARERNLYTGHFESQEDQLYGGNGYSCWSR